MGNPVETEMKTLKNAGALVLVLLAGAGGFFLFFQSTSEDRPSKKDFSLFFFPL